MLEFSNFLEYGNVIEDINTGCYVWRRTKFENGYGRYRDKRAHRVAWELVNGGIPYEKLVLHKCDNRPCVNPEHLFIGTQKDNMRDMIAKNRKVVATGLDNYATSDEYREKVSGDNHWTRRNPEKIARGSRHWSKLHPEKFSKLSENGKYQKINEIEEKKGSE